ncbi:hypothetical protein MMC30_008569 [Trapelia coarctata]|nr:hypothetical protein [Trapelia coarctata]
MENQKQTSIKKRFESQTISNDDEDIFESAIEDEDSDWTDTQTDNSASSVNEKQFFQRIDPQSYLPSRQSLLTILVHQPALRASKSTPPASPRSKTSLANGPLLAEEDPMLDKDEPDTPDARHVKITTSNTHPRALSPRTTRRNMLATELTESLPKHLLWERQGKNTTANAVLKRSHTAQDMACLSQFPTATGSGTVSNNNPWNHYLEYSLDEYHQKGW